MSARSTAKDAAVPADPDVAALDGIKPPPGCDPTMVVWREYGSLSERLRTLAACFIIYAGGGGLLILLRPGFLDSRSSIIFLVVFLSLCALFHFWVMTTPTDSIYAAGDNWFLLVGRGYSSKRRSAPSPRSYMVLKADELRRVRITTRTKVGFVVKSVRLTDVNGRYMGLQLTALRQCPPLAGLIIQAMSREDVRVGDGVREALQPAAARTEASGGGTTVVRAGFEW